MSDDNVISLPARVLPNTRRDHPEDLERAYFQDAYDHRLCNGDVVHL